MLGAAFLAMTLAAAPPAAWTTRIYKGNPVATVGDARASMTVVCFAGRDPMYALVVSGSANGVRPGEAVKATVDGRRRVTLRFRHATREDGGVARLSTFAGYRGSTGDQSGTLEALESIRTARRPITVSSRSFSITVPSTGAEAAFVALETRCGRIKPMIKRAEAREGEIP